VEQRAVDERRLATGRRNRIRPRLAPVVRGNRELLTTHTHRLTGPEALTTLVDLGAASVAAGVIARRRPVVRLLERTRADGRAAARMKPLRNKFGRGPVELVLPGRRILVILDPEDVGRVLAEAPYPFHPANIEKRKALEQFQPHGVLISKGPIRQQRRVVNEAALDYGNDLHRLAPTFVDVIAEEAAAIVDDATRRGQLDSLQFMAGWWRLVRRLNLGQSARDDEAITDVLLRLPFAHRFTRHLAGRARSAVPATGAVLRRPR
jgi:hypothetical protein